jgi:hypothetical protein
MPVVIDLPPVVGDPAGMRTLAAALRSDAGMTAVVSADVASVVEGLEFYGPAADRLEETVRLSARDGGRVADRLLSLAALLDRAAADVEREQRERERLLERLREEAIRAQTQAGL